MFEEELIEHLDSAFSPRPTLEQQKPLGIISIPYIQDYDCITTNISSEVPAPLLQFPRRARSFLLFPINRMQRLRVFPEARPLLMVGFMSRTSLTALWDCGVVSVNLRLKSLASLLPNEQANWQLYVHSAS